MGSVIFLLLGISYAVGRITVAPRNAAVVAGKMMSMECRTYEESRVRKWDLLRAGEESFTIYSHGSPSPFHPEFTHFGVQVNANGSGILYTNSTRIGDAGLYTCVTRQGPDGPTIKVSAQLTVFESQPICETNLITNGSKSLAVGDSIWFRCNVTFRGFWTPTMEWRQRIGNGDVGIRETDGVEIVRLSNESVISTLTIKVDSSVKGVFFSCKTYFTEYIGKPLDDTANNIPNFNYIWNSEAVELQNYPVPETVTGATETASASDWPLGRVIVAPRNVAVVAGDMMSMECRTDDESRVRRWDLFRVNGETIAVYMHGNPSTYNQEFIHFGARVTASGSGVLYTNSTRIDDAGLFTCVTKCPDRPTIKVTAHLIVFESQPICETNLRATGNGTLAVGDSIWFRCNVTFRGFWTPTMEWRQHSGNGNVGIIVADEVARVRSPNESVTSTLTTVVDSSMNGVFFSCKTYFSEYDGKPFDDTANDIPNFDYVWNSEAVELPNYSVSETITDSSSTLLVVGLSVFFVLVTMAVTVFCIQNKDRVRGRMLELVNALSRPPIRNQSSDEHQPSTELNSQTATDVATETRRMAATNEDYCSLIAISQEPTVYRQLLLQDTPLSDYVNLS